MDAKNKNNIFVDNPGGELTFGKMFTVLKCSLMRIVVYVLIACILAGCISLALTLTAKTSGNVTTVIEFNYTGIDKGLTPNGNSFNKDTIKDIKVLTNAIDKLGAKDSKLNPASVYSHLHVTEVIPSNILAQMQDLKDEQNKLPDKNAQLEKLEYHPTRFTITLENYESLGLNQNQAKTLVSNVYQEFQKYWEDMYSTSLIASNSYIKGLNTSFANAVGKEPSENGLDEYINYKKSIDIQIRGLERLLQDKKGINISTIDGNTYASILDRVEMFKVSQYQPIFNIILGNRIVKDKANLMTQLLNEKNDLTSKLTACTTAINEITESINMLKPDKITNVGPNGTTTQDEKYPALRAELVKQRTELAKEKGVLDYHLDTVTRMYEDLKTDGANENVELEKKVVADLKAMTDTLLDIYDDIFELDKEYKSTQPLSNSAYLVAPVAASTVGGVSKTALILTFALPILIALIAAIVVTVKLQKKFAFNFKKTSNVNTDVANGKEDDNESDSDNKDEVNE